MSLRLRLLLAFLFIVLTTLAVVSVSVRLSAVRQAELIRARGGWIGAEELVMTLQEHYSTYGSWERVETILLNPGHGMGAGGKNNQGGPINRPGVRLADSRGWIIFDPANPPGEEISMKLLQEGIPLEVNGITAGYLLPLEGQTFSMAETNEQLQRIVTNASLYAALIARRLGAGPRFPAGVFPAPPGAAAHAGC